MSRKQHTYHYIYKTTCKVNSKFYIGMHSTSNLEDGYLGSGKRLWNSIRKHGKENHEIQILEYLPDRSSLKERERELVNEDMLKDSMCMNLQLGGIGGFLDFNHQLKCSTAGGLSNAYKLKEDPEHAVKFSMKISETMKKKYEEGIIKPHPYDWTGRTHREETKAKIGKTNSDKQKGNNNSQFGKMWITNIETNENMKIHNTETIPVGWIRGRKLI